MSTISSPNSKPNMVDYADSSQLNLWQFDSPETLARCRALANRKARDFLFQRSQQQLDSAVRSTANEGATVAAADAATSAPPPVPSRTPPPSSASNTFPVENFACGFKESEGNGNGNGNRNGGQDSQSVSPWTSPQGHSYLTTGEEQLLVSFYVSKLPGLIGPMAPAVRCRRESKVAATAALLTRRFFLSNSVMIYDPKAIMVAAAFLAAKVEDATLDVRHLEEGTSLMNAPVAKDEIIPAEISLLEGTHFDLLCFHPLKCVLAVTEDLRTYLKSDQGQGLVVRSTSDNAEAGEAAPTVVVVRGQDLKPIYDAARALLDDALVSDLPLLFNPGHVGLAALMVGQEAVMELAPSTSQGTLPAPQQLPPPRIDFEGYIRQRFVEGGDVDEMLDTLRNICQMLRELKQGNWGCGNHSNDLGALKSIHKKLKKVRAWGLKEPKASSSSSSSKKRDAADKEGASERPSKKPKSMRE